VMDESQLQVTSTRGDSSLSLSTRSNLIARGRRDADELALRISPPTREADTTARPVGICNKCGVRDALVLANCVCRTCEDRIEKEWADVAATDWVLVRSRAATGWPASPEALYRYVFRSATFAQMKLRWATCDSPKGEAAEQRRRVSGLIKGLPVGFLAGSATSDDIARMRLVCAGSTPPDSPAFHEDMAGGAFGGWPRSRLAFVRPANAEEIAKYEQSKFEADRYYAGKAEWCRQIAEIGDKWGQCELGFLYYTGQGVPQDYAAAVHWFRKAVEPGKPWDSTFHEALAHYDLGLMYHNGHGVAQDYAMAANCYRTAAELGNVAARFNLGLMFENGQGVPHDLVESHMWLELSFDRGSPDDYGRAQHLEKVARMMTSEQIAEAQRRAREWKAVAAK